MNISTLLCEVPEKIFMPLPLNSEASGNNNSTVIPDVIDINQGASEICISYSISTFSLAIVKAFHSKAFISTYSLPSHFLSSNYFSWLPSSPLNYNLIQS